MIRLALYSGLSDRATEEKIVVIDTWSFQNPRTKDAVAALSALGLAGRVLVVADRNDLNTWKSFANLPEVHVVSPGELNAYDVLVSDAVVFSRDTLPFPDSKNVEVAEFPIDSAVLTEEEGSSS